MNSESTLRDNFKKLMRRGMLYAKYAHDSIFDEKENTMIALSYLNVAVSNFSAAESLYYSCISTLEQQDADNIFHMFDIFMHEFLNNVRTDHSHQWTSIEYENLKTAFDYSVFAVENL